MNLASRCNHCGTLFRVVRDQLWISEGRVRCGRCGGTFNAFDELYDLEQGKPPPWVAPEADGDARRRTADEQRDACAVDEAHEPATTSYVPASPVDGTVEDVRWGDLHPIGETPASAVTTTEEGIEQGATAEGAPWDAAARRSDDRAHDEAVVPGDAAAASAEVAPESSDDGRDRSDEEVDRSDVHARHQAVDLEPIFGVADEPCPAPAPTPEFVRRAERQARWQRPQVRLALGALSLLLLLGLLLQTSFHFRDRLAAQSPWEARAFGWLCTLRFSSILNCSSVMSVSFTRAAKVGTGVLVGIGVGVGPLIVTRMPGFNAAPLGVGVAVSSHAVSNTIRLSTMQQNPQIGRASCRERV